MTREELIKKVALKMDEISSSDDVIVPVNASDNNPLYTQINSLLNESVNDVLMKAPIYRLQSQIVSVSSDKIELKSIFSGDNRERYIAVATLPEDFIRIASISEVSFQRPIVDLAIEGDDIDKRQHNKFLVAKSAKPVAVLGRTNAGRIITCYSFEKGYTLKPTILYVKRYNNDSDTYAETDLDGYMTDIVSWVCAGKVFAAQGDINKGKLCDENALALMV
ncbi:MAG: hypothetical protein UD961_15895 [Bacteroidales bacterium]|nr:hypothetical protein [Bacteroidales bacterium]